MQVGSKTKLFMQGDHFLLRRIQIGVVNADSWARNPTQIDPKRKTKGVPQLGLETP